MTTMEQATRHQCLIYEGAPSRHLPTLAAVTSEKLQQNYRCLYLHSLPMVARMRSCLAAAGVDVADQTARTSLVFSSELEHMVDGHFDIDGMIQNLEDSIDRALSDGFDGLWGTGDMTWEFGLTQDFSRLVEYEWRLEDLFRKYPNFGCICQYHADTLPLDAVRKGILTHPQLFISDTLTLINPNYLEAELFDHDPDDPALHSALNRLAEQEGD